jgi:nitric oxide reductase subunit B
LTVGKKERAVGNYKVLWWALIAVLTVTFGILSVSGVEVYRKAPPIPAQVVTASGQVLMTRDDILDGQNAWQSTGGMQLGSIWGHGAYQAPDWSADWLHRELVAWLDLAARDTLGKPFDALDGEQKAALTYRLKQEYRHNSYDTASGVVTVSDRRAQAIAQTASYYERLYGSDPTLRPTRDNYAMKEGTLPDPAQRAKLTNFFFWTAWAASTERPGTVATYTNNWPPEPLIGNYPTPENILWSLACVVILIAGVGALIWGWAFLRRHDDTPLVATANDPLQVAV